MSKDTFVWLCHKIFCIVLLGIFGTFGLFFLDYITVPGWKFSDSDGWSIFVAVAVANIGTMHCNFSMCMVLDFEEALNNYWAIFVTVKCVCNGHFLPMYFSIHLLSLPFLFLSLFFFFFFCIKVNFQMGGKAIQKVFSPCCRFPVAASNEAIVCWQDTQYTFVLSMGQHVQWRANNLQSSFQMTSNFRLFWHLWHNAVRRRYSYYHHCQGAVLLVRDFSIETSYLVHTYIKALCTVKVA